MPTDNKPGYDPEQFFDDITRDINIKIPEPAPFPPSPSSETVVLSTNSLPVKADFNEDKTRVESIPRKTVSEVLTEDTPIPAHIQLKKGTGEIKLPPPVPKHVTKTPITSSTAAGPTPTLPTEGLSTGTNSKIRTQAPSAPVEERELEIDDIVEPALEKSPSGFSVFIGKTMSVLAIKPVQVALATVVVAGLLVVVANLLTQKPDPLKSQHLGISLDLQRPWFEYKPKYERVESLEADFSAQ